MDMRKPALSQITFAVDMLQDEDWLHSVIDLSNLWDILIDKERGITIRQLKYLHYLMFSRQKEKLVQFLESLGCPRINNSSVGSAGITE